MPINKETATSWFTNNWIWVAVAVVVLILLVALGSSSRTKRTTTTVVKDADGNVTREKTTTIE